ncbi:hypothetical protein LAZ67_4000511 [Cordylochernes scorpioides]|uniref:Gag-like protein n=1 Tax=Cordylochernes scorpioides TaxID=51811 RepID=A0ABY6KC70_9ARAC|nr:hypothetical protein LAZ67_4000511 [Cordylochernes scorpioides]
MVRRWRSWFLEGRQNLHDDERSGRPVTATDNVAVAAVRNVMEADRRVTIDEIMIRLPPGIEIGRSSIGTIMLDVLNFRKVCAIWFPRLLSENHKQQRMEAARAFRNLPQATSIFFQHSSGSLEASTLRMMTKCRRRRTTGYEDRTRLGTTVVSKNCYNAICDLDYIPCRSKAKELFAAATKSRTLDRMQILPRRSTSLAAIPTSNAAAQVRRNWADITEEVNPGAEEGFTLVQGRKRRRGSGNSPTTAAPSSNAGASRTIRRPQSSAGSVPRAQEIRATRAHIADARARQASSSEEHCVYIEHSPELEPFHYLRALDRMLGGTAGVIQITKVNGHQLLGLTNRGLAERLISEGLEVEGTLLRAFPFRKRAERITVGNLPFFVADSAVITALSPYGRVTSIAPKQMKAGPYVYVDGRRDVFITLHEGITIERLPTRLDINIKGQAWPAYLSSGIRCSRCHGQGHRRAICPLLAGLANNTRTAPPTTPAGVPPPTTPAPPQRSAAQPPAPTPSNPAMEVCSAPPVARAALHSSAPRPSPPAAPAFPMEETPPAPPPVTPAPSLQTPGSREPAAPTPDVEMSIVEETFASSTSSAKNATRVDLDAFIEGLPSVSFAKTDALGLGREEVLDLLSSRTKAQRKGPLLSPPQCDALVGLIGQILDLKPGHTSNLYKVLGQVKAELRTTPAVPPTPTLPAPWPAKPTPPALHGEKTSPDIATPPPPLSTEFIDACYDQANDIIYELSDERYLETLSDIGVTEGDIVEAIIFPDDREPLLRRLSTQKRTTLAGIVSAASERARSSDPFKTVGKKNCTSRIQPHLRMMVMCMAAKWNTGSSNVINYLIRQLETKNKMFRLSLVGALCCSQKDDDMKR